MTDLPTTSPPSRRAVAAAWAGRCARLGGLVLLAGAILGVAVVSLLGLLARYAWQLDALTFARQHLLVLALLLAGTAFLAGLRRWAMTAMLCAALNLACILPWSQLSPGRIASPAAAAGPRLKVLSLNVLAENHRTKWVKRLLRDAEADVVALQEMTTYWGEQLEPLRDLYPYATPSLGGSQHDVVILSKHPIVEAEVLPVPEDSVPSPVSAPVRAVIAVDGQEVAVYAVHPETPRSLEQWQRRNAQLAWLAGAIRQRDGDRPRLVLGDFNTPPWSPFFRDLLAGAGLRDAGGGGLRQPTRQPRLLAPRLAWLGAPVDHVLASPGLRVAGFAVGRHVNSDHLPVIAELWLPPPQSSALSPAR
jgi:endonuclease/exonuclease/phosphatase (EEP) superfamily protein YafD